MTILKRIKNSYKRIYNIKRRIHILRVLWMNQKSLRQIDVIWSDIFFKIKDWAIKQWVLYSIIRRAEIRMICKNVKKWEAFLMRLREKKLLESYMKDQDMKLWVNIKINEKNLKVIIDSEVIRNFIHKKVIWWLKLLMKAINTYKLLMINKQAVKQEMIDKKVNISVKVLEK